MSLSQGSFGFSGYQAPLVSHNLQKSTDISNLDKQRFEKGAFGTQTLVQRYASRSSLMTLSHKLHLQIFEGILLQNPADSVIAKETL